MLDDVVENGFDFVGSADFEGGAETSSVSVEAFGRIGACEVDEIFGHCFFGVVGDVVVNVWAIGENNAR